jgi:hypothetical protein
VARRVIPLLARCFLLRQRLVESYGLKRGSRGSARRSIGKLAPGTGLPVGSKVPDVHAPDLDGHDVSLASLYTKGPILLAFYRGGWCPFCKSENHQVRPSIAQILAAIDVIRLSN